MKHIGNLLGVIFVVFLTINILLVSGNNACIEISFEKLSNITTGGSPFDVQVIGNLTYVGDYYAGFSIFDVANASHPVLIDTFPLTLAHYFHVVGNFVYVACWNYGLRIINVTDPTNMTEVGSFDDVGATQKL